jgi:carbonic anhydrase/acetyltransferase-like protein (isoleucine patch superfamily)
MLLEHDGRRPRIHASAYIAPNATVSGDVTIGPESRILFGAVLTAEGGPVILGGHCVVMEQAVLRGTKAHPLRLGDHVLVGPHAHLSGCTVEDNVFVATGASVFNGARLGARSTIRINGIVHIKTVLAADAVVPIGWVAVGDPARILPPDAHDEIRAAQEPLNFSKTVFNLDPAPAGQSNMPERMRRYAAALGRHLQDRILDRHGSAEF